MADGDLYLDADWDLNPVGERMYELLGPLTRRDATDGGMMLAIVDALSVGEAPVWELAEWPGAAVALAPRTAPPEWLPLLARIVGGRFVAGMSEERMRLEVEHPAGRDRGRTSTITAYIDELLTGNRLVIYREQPYELVVRTRLSETPDPDAVLRRIKEQKPAAHTLDYQAMDERDWEEVEETWDTWADLEHLTWDDVNIP